MPETLSTLTPDQRSAMNKNITRLLQHSILQLCNEHIGYSHKLQILGVLCMTVDDEQQELVVKVNNTLKRVNPAAPKEMPPLAPINTGPIVVGEDNNLGSNSPSPGSNGSKRKRTNPVKIDLAIDDQDDVNDDDEDEHITVIPRAPEDTDAANDSDSADPKSSGSQKRKSGLIRVPQYRPSPNTSPLSASKLTIDESGSNDGDTMSVLDSVGMMNGSTNLTNDALANLIKVEPRDEFGEAMDLSMSERANLPCDLFQAVSTTNLLGSDGMSHLPFNISGFNILGQASGYMAPDIDGLTVKYTSTGPYTVGANGKDVSKLGNITVYDGAPLPGKGDGVISLSPEGPEGDFIVDKLGMDGRKRRRRAPEDQLTAEEVSEYLGHEKEEYTITCKYCPEVYDSVTRYLHHSLAAHQSYICHECGKSFTTKSSLLRHRPIHTGQRRFACSICNKTFYRKDKCKAHIKRHLGGAPDGANASFEAASANVLDTTTGSAIDGPVFANASPVVATMTPTVIEPTLAPDSPAKLEPPVCPMPMIVTE